MGTISNSLKGLTGYPVPQAVFDDAAEEQGLDPNGVMTAEIRGGKAYMRAKARVYDFLSEAPNITQAGISYSYSDEDRKRFRQKAESLRSEADGNREGIYGYQGEDL
jgi:hypothetical protein